VVEALVVLLVAGSVGVLGTALLLRSQRPADEALPDQLHVMRALPPVPPPLELMLQPMVARVDARTTK